MQLHNLQSLNDFQLTTSAFLFLLAALDPDKSSAQPSNESLGMTTTIVTINVAAFVFIVIIAVLAVIVIRYLFKILSFAILLPLISLYDILI